MWGDGEKDGGGQNKGFLLSLTEDSGSSTEAPRAFPTHPRALQWPGRAYVLVLQTAKEPLSVLNCKLHS